MTTTETAIAAPARKPAFKVGDIVLANGSWYLVTSKVSKRCRGRLLYRHADTIYSFTSNDVERVFREMGKRRG